MAILSLIAALIPYLQGFTGSKWTSLAEALTVTIESLWGKFRSGASTLSEIESTLAALTQAARDVQHNSDADPHTLGMVTEILAIVNDAGAGVEAAEAGADPAELPIPPPVE